MERYRAQMQTPDALPAWAIAGETERRMTVSGPWLKPGRVVEVVPREQLRGAVEALRWIANAEPDPDEGVRPLDDLLDRIQGEAKAALDALGGR
jgi:hypothetical protein